MSWTRPRNFVSTSKVNSWVYMKSMAPTCLIVSLWCSWSMALSEAVLVILTSRSDWQRGNKSKARSGKELMKSAQSQWLVNLVNFIILLPVAKAFLEIHRLKRKKVTLQKSKLRPRRLKTWTCLRLWFLHKTLSVRFRKNPQKLDFAFQGIKAKQVRENFRHQRSKSNPTSSPLNSKAHSLKAKNMTVASTRNYLP